MQWTTKYRDFFYIYFLKYPSSLSFLKHCYLTKKFFTYNIYEFVINNTLSGLEYLHWPEGIIFLLLQNLQMGKLCQSFVGHEIRARELASLTKFKCSQTSAKTARCICHQRVNSMYNGRFHRPGRLWSLSHATGKTTLLILGLAFPEALSSINTVCAHTGSMVTHSALI